MALLLSTLLLANIAGCVAPKPAALPTTPVAGATSKPLRVGTSGDYPPFSVRDATGNLSGFDVAVAQAYALDRGRQLELVTFAWPDLERRFVAGDFDVVMSGVTVRGDRLALAPMTAAVARAAAVLAVPAARKKAIATDGAGLTVAVNRGGHLERVARARLPRATIVTVDDNRSLPAVLASGEVDGVITDSLELQSLAAHGGAPPRIAAVLSEDRKAYWVSPRDAALADDLDAWLARREASGTLAQLRRQHFGAGGEVVSSSTAALDPAALRVVDLVARRLLLMPEVAEVKRAAALPVDAPAREAIVYAQAREAAQRDGLAPEPYAALVRAEVEVAKVVQRAVLARPAAVAALTNQDDRAGSAALAKARLDGQIRPAIDRIDQALRRALVADAPVRASVVQLARALRAYADVPGLDAGQAKRLAEALARIPAAEGRAAKILLFAMRARL